MRVHNLLPNYLLQGDGSVIEKETGEFVPVYEKGQYRLQTAESVFLETKDKEIELIRRFSPADIVKLYQHSDEYVSTGSVSEIPEKTPKVNEVNTFKSAENALSYEKVNSKVNEKVNDEVNSTEKQPGVYLNGKRFDSLSQASEISGISKSTINKRIQSDNFPTYYRIE